MKPEREGTVFDVGGCGLLWAAVVGCGRMWMLEWTLGT